MQVTSTPEKVTEIGIRSLAGSAEAVYQCRIAKAEAQARAIAMVEGERAGDVFLMDQLALIQMTPGCKHCGYPTGAERACLRCGETVKGYDTDRDSGDENDAWGAV